MRGTRFLIVVVALGMFVALAVGAVVLKRTPDLVADVAAPGFSAPVASAFMTAPAQAAAAPIVAAGAAATAVELPSGPVVALNELATAEAGQWSEDQATRRYWNAAQQLAWQAKPIDYVDADGIAQGGRAFAERSFSATAPVRLEIPGGLRDLFIVGSKGRSVFKTKESGAGPVLELSDGRRLQALADTDIESTTSRPLGKRETMRVEGANGILIRFPMHSLPGILTLQRVERSAKPVTLKVYKANPRAPALAGPTKLPAAHKRVFRLAAADVARRPQRQKLSGEWLQTWLDRASAPQTRCNETKMGCAGLVLVQDRRRLPESLDRAAMVTYFRIGGIWSDTGGKMPGLGNSGDTTPGHQTCVGERCFGDAGWGGRKANGLRWHARGLFTGSGDTARLGWGTYLYSLNVNDGSYGKHLAAAEPLSPGEVVASVQYIDVNDVGSDNGMLGQWLCRAAGCTPMLWRQGIRFRNVASPEALVNEMDIVIYCGGMQCKMKDGQRFEYDFHSASVFDGMPDLGKVAGEVSRLASTVPRR